MKMKSKFFGLSAKLALAILAVGTTLTSCYDSENVDIVAPSQPEPATYVIVGNITDAATGLPLSEGVAVTVDGNAQTVNASGYFEATGLSAGSHEVKVSAPTYNDAVRTIYLAETAEGGVCVGNADFALYTADASADLVYPDGGYEGDGVDAGKPATKEQAEVSFEPFSFNAAIVSYHDTPSEAFVDAGKQFSSYFVNIYRALGSIFTEDGWQNLGGLISIYRVNEQAITSGSGFTFINLWAYISLNLGCFNLIPLPPLDGWNVLLALGETVTRKKFSSKFKGIAGTIGTILLIILAVLLIVKDIIMPI